MSTWPLEMMLPVGAAGVLPVRVKDLALTAGLHLHLLKLQVLQVCCCVLRGPAKGAPLCPSAPGAVQWTGNSFDSLTEAVDFPAKTCKGKEQVTHPAFWRVALGVLMLSMIRLVTPGLMPVKEAGVKPLATMTWAAVADLTSTLVRVEAGSLDDIQKEALNYCKTPSQSQGNEDCRQAEAEQCRILSQCACVRTTAQQVDNTFP